MSAKQIIKKLGIAVLVIVGYRVVVLFYVGLIGMPLARYMYRVFDPLFCVYLSFAVVVLFAFPVGWVAAKFLAGFIPAVITGLIAVAPPWYRTIHAWRYRNELVPAVYLVVSVGLIVLGAYMQRRTSRESKADDASPKQGRKSETELDI